MIKKLYIIVGLAAIGVGGTAFGEECPSGLDGNLCRAESGDRRAMYMVARAAYVKENESIKDGATVVDFSHAYEWAWKSKKLGFQGGNSVLKMIYVNAAMHKFWVDKVFHQHPAPSGIPSPPLTAPSTAPTWAKNAANLDSN